MSVDKSGKWWVGDSPEDIEEFLTAYSDDSYRLDEFRLSRCACNSVNFRLSADDVEGAARRECVNCGAEKFICDSEEYWDEADPDEWSCIECNSTTTNIGVGFSLYEDKREIRWLYVGVRCSSCGVLGCFAGWKIGYGPSLQLLDEV